MPALPSRLSSLPLVCCADAQGTPAQKEYHHRILARKTEYMEKHNLPIWNGEFGPVYANDTDGPDWEKVNDARYGVLEYQLSLYRKADISWSIWLWKGECQAKSGAEELMARYRLSRDGVCRERYTLYDVVEALLGEKEGEFARFVDPALCQLPPRPPAKLTLASRARRVGLRQRQSQRRL